MIELHAASFVFGILAGVGLSLMTAGVVVILIVIRQARKYFNQPTSKQGD